jgi:hypothetical protein
MTMVRIGLLLFAVEGSLSSHRRLERRHVGCGDGPGEGCKFSRDGDDDDVGRLSGAQETPVTSAQPELRLPGDLLDGFGQLAGTWPKTLR